MSQQGAIIECGECGGPVPEGAKRCMHCGVVYEPWYTTWWGFLAVAVAAVMLTLAFIVRPGMS